MLPHHVFLEAGALAEVARVNGSEPVKMMAVSIPILYGGHRGGQRHNRAWRLLNKHARLRIHTAAAVRQDAA